MTTNTIPSQLITLLVSPLGETTKVKVYLSPGKGWGETVVDDYDYEDYEDYEDCDEGEDKENNEDQVVWVDYPAGLQVMDKVFIHDLKTELGGILFPSEIFYRIVPYHKWQDKAWLFKILEDLKPREIEALKISLKDVEICPTNCEQICNSILKFLFQGFLEIPEDCEQIIIQAFGLKVLSAIKWQGDTKIEVEPRFYSYKTDVINLASYKKQDLLRQENSMMFGVELEFSHSKYSLKELFPILSMGIFKYDSSVDGEYVTLPYTYREMVSKITSLSETFDKLLSANGWEGNGMHVHVSRKNLTQNQILNLQCLLNPSSSEGQQYWSKVADRELRGNHYCDFLNHVTEDTNALYKASRYVILNLTNEHTIEFRMFKSPSCTLGVLWNLSIVMGLIEFSKQGNSFLLYKKPNSLKDWMISPLNPMNQ